MSIVVKLLVVVLVGLAILLYSPVPDGYSTASNLKLRLIFAHYNAIVQFGHTAERLGLENHVHVVRGIMDKMATTAPAPDPEDDEELEVKEVTIEGIPVRIYDPVHARKAGVGSPALIYLHGGGWVFGSLDQYDASVRALVKETELVYFSVGYRLAPEHVFPAAHDDCVKVTKTILKNAAKLRLDPKRIAIGGDSAGGNLATTVALRLRDEKFKPALKLQVLIYPVTQSLDYKLPSMLQHSNGPILTTHQMAWYASTYVAGENETMPHIFFKNNHLLEDERRELQSSYLSLEKLPLKHIEHYDRPKVKEGNTEVFTKYKNVLLNPYFNPLIAPSLKGLPNTILFTCDFDVLRDEGFLYAERLRRDGVKVNHIHDPRGFHAQFLFAPDVPEVEESFKNLAEQISSSL